MVDFANADLGRAAISLGMITDKRQVNKLKGIGDEISNINKELRNTVSYLKRELEILKTKNKDSDHYDITNFHEKLIDFQEIYNRGKGPYHHDRITIFDSAEAYEKIKKFEKPDFEKLLKQLDEIETQHKDRSSDAGQQLLLMGHEYTLIMNMFQEAMRSYSRAQERLAQASRSH